MALGGTMHLLALSSLLGSTTAESVPHELGLSDHSTPTAHLIPISLFKVTPEDTVRGEQASASSEQASVSNAAMSRLAAGSPKSISPGSASSAQLPPSPERLPHANDFAAVAFDEPLNAAHVNLRQAMRSLVSGSATGSFALGSGDSSAQRGAGSTGGASEASAQRAAARLQLKTAPQCSDLFPHQASSDSGFVIVEVKLNSAGSPQLARVVEEYPVRQGFARAAEACAERFEFLSLDVDQDAAAQVRSIIKLRFARTA